MVAHDGHFSIKVYKQYFNFAASHFLIFKDGTREPLHGHNYRVSVTGHGPCLEEEDVVFDFLDIKPIVRQVCDSLDHKLLLPAQNRRLNIEADGPNYWIFPPDGSRFSVPRSDVLLLPLSNTSVERLASYLAQQIGDELAHKHQFAFQNLEVEVEESPGQSASYLFKGRDAR